MQAVSTLLGPTHIAKEMPFRMSALLLSEAASDLKNLPMKSPPPVHLVSSLTVKVVASENVRLAIHGPPSFSPGDTTTVISVCLLSNLDEVFICDSFPSDTVL